MINASLTSQYGIIYLVYYDMRRVEYHGDFRKPEKEWETTLRFNDQNSTEPTTTVMLTASSSLKIHADRN